MYLALDNPWMPDLAAGAQEVQAANSNHCSRHQISRLLPAACPRSCCPLTGVEGAESQDGELHAFGPSLPPWAPGAGASPAASDGCGDVEQEAEEDGDEGRREGDEGGPRAHPHQGAAFGFTYATEPGACVEARCVRCAPASQLVCMSCLRCFVRTFLGWAAPNVEQSCMSALQLCASINSFRCADLAALGIPALHSL